ncbi:hypothetical protein RZS08_18515, partial [Arthrospira platensis SPKY1]|nr:hypothetical protein [Arthrospira platensis SPKY1]
MNLPLVRERYTGRENTEETGMNSTTTIRYTGVAIGLHWLMAALIVAGFALGWTVAEMEFSPQKLR